MSKNSSSTTTTRTHSSNFILNLLSYVAVVICGLVLFIVEILNKCGVTVGFLGTLSTIANAIGWAVLCLLSFNYIKRRRKIWMWVIWAIAVVMIVVSIILAVV